MSIIDDVRRERTDLARVLKKHAGIRRIVEDLYPDSAHFIYELLQNAEDTGATEARFRLIKESLVFEHNGRSFDQADLLAITDIGAGSKTGAADKIGCFGIGFKAVFAYSETPMIWGSTLAFKISDLVLPSELDPLRYLRNWTRFEFPFNNPKKLRDIAFAEITAGLTKIAETTLLFLTHLQSIDWTIEGGFSGKVLRVPHPDHHFEINKKVDGKTTTSSHFLKFEKPVKGLNKQCIAVAFALDFLPNTQQLDPEKAISKQLKIVSATPGRVAVYFPAEKETSGLRFHLHAPFVPELSRASIKETPANQPLFTQLSTLAAEALHQIHDLDLLAMEFLGVLPNPQDESIPPRYQSIRDAILVEMNEQSLTPTHARNHAPARRLIQGKAVLKELLSEEDLEFLIDYEDEPLQWAMAAPQKYSNADRLLSGLAITEWDIDEFFELVTKGTSNKAHYNKTDSNKDFMTWLSGKSIEWHQQFYAFLYKELGAEGKLDRVRDLNIVRLAKGNYCIGTKCFFPGKDDVNDDELPRVDIGVYTSGKSKTQQENARKLLEEIGVREVGEAEKVETILEKRYLDKLKPKRNDLNRFITLVEKEPDKANLFSAYFIFQGSDGCWRKPDDVFLDQPFMDTGLKAWYAVLGKEGRRIALNAWYQSCEIKSERLAKFAEAVGAQRRLEIETTSCEGNPERGHLLSVGGFGVMPPHLDRDFHISDLERLLSKPSLAISKLLWETMCMLPTDFLQASYQKNQNWGVHKADSQLIHCLRSTTWIPQSKKVFVRPAEALRDKLPEGFPFDSGWKWLKAIHFGQEVAKRYEEQTKKLKNAKELGFPDADSLARALRFGALPPAEQDKVLADLERRQSTKLTEPELANPDRRTARAREQAVNAPERQTEHRTRSVSVERDAVKIDTDPYLQDQYTNGDGEMICQVCRAALPFKLSDGSYYFVAVEFLSELRKRYYQNYLALCPNHAAMFKHANGSGELLMDMFLEINGNELKVVFADEDTTIYFTKRHIIDLQAVIEVDQRV